MGDTGYNNVGETKFMNLQTIAKILVASLMISVVAGAATAQTDAPEVETQQEPEQEVPQEEVEEVPQEEVLDNETDLPEQASDNASDNVRLPGERFYGLTQLSERAELAVARAPVVGSEDREARTLANHAEKRLAESEGLSENGDSERATQALERYSESVSAASERAENSGNEETQQRIAEASENHEERLNRVAERVPEEAQQGIQTALENSREARRGPPSDGQGPQEEDDRGASQAPEDSPNGDVEQPGNESGQEQEEAQEGQAENESAAEQPENGEETQQQEDSQPENESGQQQESEEDEDSDSNGFQTSR